MTVAPGTSIGRYEVIDLLGRGAMGVVYRARDGKLQREVAVKVLPPEFAADPERLRRFDQEALAAGSLNHPNVVTVFDVGTHDRAPYVVTELLEGNTLRERLEQGPLPLRKVFDFGAQIARGLAAAHAKGIVHRDLKPENLFVTRSGQVKILDFGIAKLSRRESVLGGEQGDSLAATATGMIVGTVGYMAPEQVRGEATDHRADLFALGCVLYEMTTGVRAFHGASMVDTMSAILQSDLPEFPEPVRTSGPALIAVIRHLVEKSPAERFESARDLAFGLETVLASAATARSLAPAPAASVPTPEASFRRITFRRGITWTARFMPDGLSVVYGGAWEGAPVEMFHTHLASRETRAFDLTRSNVLSVSSTGEMAVLRNVRFTHAFFMSGTLARVSAMGGAPREMLHDVHEAEWSPDGPRIAVARELEGVLRVEFPPGNVLFETTGWVGQMRFSPDGQRLAFIDHSTRNSDDGRVVTVDLKGELRTLSEGWGTARGLAWSPDGKEVWFTADREGAARGLYAVDLDGRLRKVLQLASNMTIHDIARDGRALVSHGNERAGVNVLPPGAERERDLSWMDWTLTSDLSPDGRTLLFTETAEGGGLEGSVFLRSTDGSPALRLTEGNIAHALSPDGRWVLASPGYGRENNLRLVPTGAGEVTAIPLEGFAVTLARFLNDGTHVVVAAREKGRAARLYRVVIRTGERTPISVEGITGTSLDLSPDGRWIVAGLGNGFGLFPVEGGEHRTIAGLQSGEGISGFSSDSRSVFAYRPEDVPVRVDRVDIETGERTFCRMLAPPDPTGIYRIGRLKFAMEGEAYAYSYFLHLLDLHVIDGLR